jgi:hypothetical protein
MPLAVEVFTPNDTPTFSYVERKNKFENRLREALSIPKMIISISGPSKSGKTVLVKTVVPKDTLIPLSGATIKAPDSLWTNTLNWMVAPTEQTQTNEAKVSVDAGLKGGGELGIPLLAKGKAEATATVGTERATTSMTKTYAGGLTQVIREIADSDFTLFIDDFHYIPKDVQREIGQQIKQAAESGVRIITASVPHRSDDVVRSNTELRGRVTAIDTNYWNE